MEADVKQNQLIVWDRANRRPTIEKVFGGDALRWAYQSSTGRMISSQLWIKRLMSHFLGWYYSSRYSRSKIPGFIAKFEIPMSDYIQPAKGFQSFNDFFVRLFRQGVRSFPSQKNVLGSPAEGRLTVFEIRNRSASLLIKGQDYELSELVGAQFADRLPETGHVWVFRLCPVDYHCFHYPDDGDVVGRDRLGHDYDSVNPWAHLAVPGIFLKNVRDVSLLKTKNFGTLFQIEVGALGVALIEQDHMPGQSFLRGQVKGRFLFGASTVILVTGSHIRPHSDIKEQTQGGMECLVRLGEAVAESELVSSENAQ